MIGGKGREGSKRRTTLKGSNRGGGGKREREARKRSLSTNLAALGKDSPQVKGRERLWRLPRERTLTIGDGRAGGRGHRSGLVEREEQTAARQKMTKKPKSLGQVSKTVPYPALPIYRRSEGMERKSAKEMAVACCESREGRNYPYKIRKKTWAIWGEQRDAPGTRAHENITLPKEANNFRRKRQMTQRLKATTGSEGHG